MLLRKKSNVAIHFYKTGSVRLLQKTKVKSKSGRGRPKTVRQIVTLDQNDIHAFALIVHEAQARASIATKKAVEKLRVKAEKKAVKAEQSLLKTPKLDTEPVSNVPIASTPPADLAPIDESYDEPDRSQVLSENQA